MELLLITVLILVGAILLALEVCFIPGFGLTGVLGAMSLLGAVSYSFVYISALAGWCTIAIVIVLLVVLILWAVYGKSIDNVALKKNIDSSVENPDSIGIAVGDEGVAITRLALVGEVDFAGKIVEVSSASGFVEENTRVQVTRIAGGTIFVKGK